MDDFDSVKSNVKVVLSRQAGCNIATNSSNAVFLSDQGGPMQLYQDELSPNPGNLSTYEFSGINLYGNSVIKRGDDIGKGLVVNKIAFDYDRLNAPRTPVNHLCDGPGGPQVRALESAVVTLQVQAQAPNTNLSQSLQPLKVAILTDPTDHNKVVGYEFSNQSQTAPESACAQLGGTYDTTTHRCNLLSSTSCPSGQYLTGLNSDGSPVCASMISLQQICSSFQGFSFNAQTQQCIPPVVQTVQNPPQNPTQDPVAEPASGTVVGGCSADTAPPSCWGAATFTWDAHGGQTTTCPSGSRFVGGTTSGGSWSTVYGGVCIKN